jgi:hypothetical protein
MMEPFPSTWKDTPKKQAHWAQMLRNNAFLRQQKCLQCHYCHKAVRIGHWSKNYNVATVDHITSFLLLGVALTIPWTCLSHVGCATWKRDTRKTTGRCLFIIVQRLIHFWQKWEMSSDESVGKVELDSCIQVVDNILFCLYLYFYARQYSILPHFVCLCILGS